MGPKKIPKLPNNYANYPIQEIRDPEYYTKRWGIDDASDMTAWDVFKLKTFIMKMREAVHSGYGDPDEAKTLPTTWNLYPYEFIDKRYVDNHSDKELANLGLQAYDKLEGKSANDLLPLAGRYRLQDYRRALGGTQSYQFDNYVGPEKGFNPYRLHQETCNLIVQGKYLKRYLRYNEKTGIFDAPELADKMKKLKDSEFKEHVLNYDHGIDIDIRDKQIDKLKKENEKLMRKINIQNEVINARPPSPQKTITATNAKNNNKKTPREQPKEYDEDGVLLYCSYCRAYIGHKAYKCQNMREERPTGCWNCGEPKGTPTSHNATQCPNPRKEGVQWNPGYGPRQGVPRTRITSIRPQPRAGQVFKRTSKYDEETTCDLIDSNDADCVKLYAQNLENAFITKENPKGNVNLTGAYITSARMLEKSIADREIVNNYEQNRRVAEREAEREVNRRTFVIGNIDIRYHNDFYCKDNDGNLDKREIKAQVAKRLNYELDKKVTDIEITAGDVYLYETYVRKRTFKNADGKEEEYEVFDLKVELYSRSLSLKYEEALTDSLKGKQIPTADREIGVLPKRYLHPAEERNDKWVYDQVVKRNETQDHTIGTWIVKGRPGLTKPVLKKTEETIQKERETREAAKRARSAGDTPVNNKFAKQDNDMNATAALEEEMTDPDRTQERTNDE